MVAAPPAKPAAKPTAPAVKPAADQPVAAGPRPEKPMAAAPAAKPAAKAAPAAKPVVVEPAVKPAVKPAEKPVVAAPAVKPAAVEPPEKPALAAASAVKPVAEVAPTVAPVVVAPVAKPAVAAEPLDRPATTALRRDEPAAAREGAVPPPRAPSGGPASVVPTGDTAARLAAPSRATTSRRDLLRLGLGALGVVYGDIGTSPLYAVRECFGPEHAIAPSVENVLGVLSLVIWSLSLVVVVKYLTFVMRADNEGEGGIMALLALINRKISPSLGWTTKPVLILLALFGTSLLFADGMITPAISVLSAVEGLTVDAPGLHPYVVPVTLVILIGLFLVQKRGTGGVGAVFGPAMLLWFAAIGALGALWILREPRIFQAILPWHAVRFFLHEGERGFLVLGSVVLCITGTEALYADMGHFGRRPIHLAWYAVVFPALLLNYLGQGAALLVAGQEAVKNPFYALAPRPLLYPLVAVATAATVIASQALISGSFSLAQQAMQLGYSPRLHLIHTSSRERGQIYVPEINSLLMISCCALVLIFKNSSSLAAAYGIAVMGTMVITSFLLYSVMRDQWGWTTKRSLALTALFLAADLPFLLANLTKLAHGGLVPLVVGGAFFAVLTTWKHGRKSLADTLTKAMLPIEQFMPTVSEDQPFRVRGTAVFMTSNQDVVPPVLLHHFKHNKVLHEKVILLCVVTEQVPEVSPESRVSVRDRGAGMFQVLARYGFMQTPNVPEIMQACAAAGLSTDLADTSYFLGRETLLTTGRSGMSRWRKGLFAFLSRNARPATAFFGIPANRVVELGTQVEL
jgi:KUP system potassium uptake protein